MGEADIQKTCIEILKVYGIFHWRNNTGVAQMGNRRVAFGKKGSPDIIAVYGGQFLGIEVKDKGKKQTKVQKEFQKDLENAGGIYIVIDDADTLIQFLNNNRYVCQKI